MADEVDLANAQAERWLAQARKNALEKPRMQPKGCCYFCEEPFKEGSSLLFCDADCRDGFEKEQKLKNRG